MDAKKTTKVQKTQEVLLSDRHYFSYVFKKTEKIVCVVFYILHNRKDINEHKRQITLDIERTAKQALAGVTETLSSETQEIKPQLTGLLALLVSFQSHLELARSVGIMRDDVVDVLVGELEGVMRSIAAYIHTDKNVFDFNEVEDVLPQATVRKAKTPTVSVSSEVRQTDRQDAIQAVIAAKGKVSIKDISDTIKDCSEKTIQRELTLMIEKGLIKREGERRWSQYSLI